MIPGEPRSEHARSVALMVVAPLLWSIAGVFTRHIEAAGRWELVFWRSLFCAIGIVVLAAFMYRGAALRRFTSMGWPGLASGLLWATMFTAFMVALTLTTVANVLVLSSLSPLTATVFARMFLGERIALRTWLIVLLALAGIVVMFGSGAGGGSWLGNLVSLGVPVAAGLNWVILRKTRAHVDLVPAVFVGAVLSALATLPLALPGAATPRDFALLGTLGFFQLALPCTLSVLAARHLSPTEMGLLSLLEVLFGTFWAWLGAGERPGGYTLAGGALILAALVTEAIARGRRATA